MSQETCTHTLSYYLTHFVNTWGKSLKQRAKAAKYYAQACDEYDYVAQLRFEALEEYKDWPRKEWWRVYFVGAGLLLPQYLDAPDATTANTLVWHSVSLEDQQDILDNGLELATSNGGTQVVPLKNLTPHQVARAFIKADGSRRSDEDQIQWLEEHVRPNLVVLTNGAIRVSHACHIQKNVLADILVGENHPFSSEELYALGDTLRARGE